MNDPIGIRCARLAATLVLVSLLAGAAVRPALAQEDLRAQAEEAWRQLLDGLAADGAIRLAGDRVARQGHDVALAGADHALAERIAAAFRGAHLYGYDAAGRRSRVLQRTAGLEFDSAFEYDELDRVRRRAFPDGEAFDYVYEGFGCARSGPTPRIRSSRLRSCGAPTTTRSAGRARSRSARVPAARLS